MVKEKIQIGPQEIIPGSSFTVEALSPIAKPVTVGGEVEAIRGGGFYGKVILLKDKVIKTTEPDSWHELWRHINWGLFPFPSQSSELAAQLDFLAGRIINRIVPAVTNGRVITPDSIGYVDLGKIGFGQAIERMSGRGARFYPENENKLFNQTRQEIWQLGIALGLEQAAQVHPDNPFGKQNLWTTDDGQMIWLDVLPAIKHTGWVWPAFNFKFHKDVREKIGDGDETFNRIHTDRLRQFFGNRSEELSECLDVYDEILRQFSGEMETDKRTLVIEDAVRRGLVSSGKAEELMNSDAAYVAFLAGTVVRPALGAFMEFISDTHLYRAFADRQSQTDIMRFVRDPMFRRQRFIEHTILNGAREAYNLGLINEREWEGAWDVLSQPAISKTEARKLASTYLGLQAWYTISSSIINSVSIPLMASSIVAENPGARLALGLFVDIVVPPVVRMASTLAVSLMTKQELKTAIKVSALPKLGGYLAVPADMAYRFGNRSEMIWHYTKRGLIASLSKVLRPWGGWNSDLEATLWDKLRVERW